MGAAGYDLGRNAVSELRPNRRRRRRDWGRALARLLCAVFALIGAIPLRLGVPVRTPWVRTWAAAETAALLQRELGLAARYEVTVQAWPLSVELADVRIDGSDGKGPALAVARIA